MAVFSAAEQRRLRPAGGASRFLGDHPAVSWTIAALVGLSFATFSPPDTPGVYGAEYWVRWFLFGVFAFFLLAPAMFGDQTAGAAGASSPADRSCCSARCRSASTCSTSR